MATPATSFGPTSPQLSPVLLMGMAARVLPLPPLQQILRTMMRRMARQHPGIFERLDTLDNPHFRIDPLDLPWTFHLDVTQAKSRLSASLSDKPEAGPTPAATIRGSLATLSLRLLASLFTLPARPRILTTSLTP